MELASTAAAPPGPERPAAPATLACYGPGVEFLLNCKAFSCDVLLIAAEACDELEVDLGCRAMPEAASAAADLARRLRAEASTRHAAPLCRPLPLLDRAILVQAHASARGEKITSGEALLRAQQQEEQEQGTRSYAAGFRSTGSVAGGAA